jgi:hypothetical protein
MEILHQGAAPAMSNDFVSFNAPDNEAATLPRSVDDPMFRHPRVPGELWDAIGWTEQQAANLAADLDRGAYQRKGWFGTGNPDKAA